MDQQDNKVNLEDALQGLFRTSVSGTGEEELLRLASTFSRQISAVQIRAILVLEHLAFGSSDQVKAKIAHLITRWVELKQYNNSDTFVMRALDSISLRKFINENTMKIDVKK